MSKAAFRGCGLDFGSCVIGLWETVVSEAVSTDSSFRRTFRFARGEQVDIVG